MRHLFNIGILLCLFFFSACEEKQEEQLPPVSVFQGIEPETGTYSTILSSNYGPDFVSEYTFLEEGIVVHRGDTVQYEKDKFYYTMKFDYVTKKTKCLFFKKNGQTCFINNAFEKISGIHDELMGEYESYLEETDRALYDDEIRIQRLNISEWGYEMYQLPETSSGYDYPWTIGEINFESIFFVDYLDSRFVVLTDFDIYVKED